MAGAATQQIHSHETAGVEPDFADIALDYARRAVADKKGQTYCKWVRLAAKRHLNDLKKQRRKAYPYTFDPWHANDVCDFIEKLPHIEGTWDTPTIRLEPAQIFWLASIFGWRRKSDGRRRFTNVYIEVARKNAKSTLTAGVVLYCFTCEEEPAPYIFIGATTGEQAQKVFHPARMMAQKTPALCDHFGLSVWARSITEPGGGYVKTINAKASTQDGHNPHVGVLDELHAHKDRALHDVIRSAFGARKSPLFWKITTAGYDTNGVCYEQRKLTTKILDGLVDADHFFGIIYTLDEKDDPYSEKVWIKANPLLGVSVQLDELRGSAIEAKASPESAEEFKTKKTNIWVTAKGGHINIVRWRQCSGAVDLEALRDVPCWGGLDLGSTSDLTGFRLVWHLDGKLYTWGKCYLPEDTVEDRSNRNGVPYREWQRAGAIIATPGNVTDYAWVEKDIREALETFNVQSIGFDPWNSTDLVNRLLEDDAPMLQVRQGPASMSAPMKELDRLYLSRRLCHGGDPVLTWCASNVVARKDENENIAPSKKQSMEKIDAYSALVNAMAVSMTAGVEGPSVYNERDILTV